MDVLPDRDALLGDAGPLDTAAWIDEGRRQTAELRGWGRRRGSPDRNVRHSPARAFDAVEWLDQGARLADSVCIKQRLNCRPDSFMQYIAVSINFLLRDPPLREHQSGSQRSSMILVKESMRWRNMTIAATKSRNTARAQLSIELNLDALGITRKAGIT